MRFLFKPKRHPASQARWLLPACPMSSAIRSKSPLMIISAVSGSHIWRFSFELPASKKTCQFSVRVCQLFPPPLSMIINWYEFLVAPLVRPPTHFPPSPSFLCLSTPPLPLFLIPSYKKKKYVLGPASVSSYFFFLLVISLAIFESDQ